MDSEAPVTNPTGKKFIVLNLHELARLYLTLYKTPTNQHIDLIIYTDLQVNDWLEQTQPETPPYDQSDTYRVIQNLADHIHQIPPIEQQLHRLVTQIRGLLNDHEQTTQLMWSCPKCATRLYRHKDNTVHCPEPQCDMWWEWEQLENMIP